MDLCLTDGKSWTLSPQEGSWEGLKKSKLPTRQSLLSSLQMPAPGCDPIGITVPTSVRCLFHRQGLRHGKQLGAVVGAEFAQDGGNVGFDGGFGDGQFVCDLLVELAVANA